MSQSSLYLIFSSISVGVVSLIGLYLLIPGLAALLRARTSQGWPSAQGIIIESGVERREYKQSISRTRRTRVSYYPRVVYRYTAAGQTYNGERISFGARVGDSNSDTMADKVVGYPVGSSVEVFYDPSDPASAILERHPSWTPIYAGLGMLALAIGLAVLLYAIR